MNSTLPTLISPSAKIGKNVEIGYGTRVYKDAIIEDSCRIGDHCVIGLPTDGVNDPLRIGSDAVIRSHSTLYAGSTLGSHLQTGHHVLIRDGTRTGSYLQVGSFSDIEGNCSIGSYCRFHGYTHVGRGSKIGNFVWLYSLTTLTNDPLPPSDIFSPVVIEDGVVVCVGALLLPGTILRRGCYVSAQSVASGDVPPGAVINGPQGTIVSHVSFLMNLQHQVRHPWMAHHTHKFPREAIPQLNKLRDAILAERDEFVRRHLNQGE